MGAGAVNALLRDLTQTSGMMNGLQTLSYWRDYFGNPTEGELGLFNAIQVSVFQGE